MTAARRWPRPRWLELPYPEAAIVEEETLEEQTLALAADLPDRPLVLGGCCCSHVGAVEGLAARHGRLAVVWFDAHGDLNTPESSPSGKRVGDAAADADRLRRGRRRATWRWSAPATSIRRRRSSSQRAGCISASRDRAARSRRADCVYVAFDVDVLDPREVAVFMPEPDGLSR